MNGFVGKAVTALCMAVVLVAGSRVVAAEERPDGVLGQIGIDQHLGEPVPLDVVFRDEKGERVALGDLLRGKPVILTPVYYECPMLCNLVLNGLVAALRTLQLGVGSEFDVITFSFDPREKPELAAAKKRSYLERYGRGGAEDGWHFLTGDEEAVRRLTEAIGFRYSFDEERSQFAHAGGIMILAPDGRLARYFYGIEYAPRDLRLGLVEASQNRIGTVVDRVLLYCYQYDPATGRYSAMTLNAVRLGGLLTVAAVGIFIATMLRRERRGSAAARSQES